MPTYCSQEDPWKCHLIMQGQYDSFKRTLAERKIKTPDKPTRTREQIKTKAHMPTPKITNSTPPNTHQKNQIPDLTEK